MPAVPSSCLCYKMHTSFEGRVLYRVLTCLCSGAGMKSWLTVSAWRPHSFGNTLKCRPKNSPNLGTSDEELKNLSCQRLRSLGLGTHRKIIEIQSQFGHSRGHSLLEMRASCQPKPPGIRTTWPAHLQM